MVAAPAPARVGNRTRAIVPASGRGACRPGSAVGPGAAAFARGPAFAACDDGRTTAEDHREPLRRAQPAGHARAARRRPRAAVVATPRSRSSPARGGPEGARGAGAWARSRAPTSTTTSTSPAARGARSAIAEAMVGDGRARPRLAARRAGGMWRHQHRSNRANIALSLRRLQRVLPAVARPADGLLVRVFQRRTATRSTTRRRASSTTSAASCASRPASASSTSAAAGARSSSRRREHYGVEATGITLSQNQFDHVTREIAARGLDGRVRVELRDYLDLPEDALYDKIASVGHVRARRASRRFPQVFRQDLPRPEARAASC